MIFYQSSCVDFSSFFFPVKGSVKCVIVFQYIALYLPMKFCTKRSYLEVSVEELKVLEEWKAWH